MAPTIAYVEVTLLQYNSVFFIATWPIRVCDMDHYANLLSDNVFFESYFVVEGCISSQN